MLPSPCFRVTIGEAMFGLPIIGAPVTEKGKIQKKGKILDELHTVSSLSYLVNQKAQVHLQGQEEEKKVSVK